MSKKRLNSILLIGVAFIWGLLIYKFFGNSFSANDNQQNFAIVSNEEKPITVQKDTFDLKTYTRDPFLGNIVKTRRAVSGIKNRTISSKKTKPLVTVQWPQLHYLGFVKETKAKEPLLLLKVNGKLMRKKSSFEFAEGFKVLNFYKDSIVVQFNAGQKTIKKG